MPRGGSLSEAIGDAEVSRCVLPLSERRPVSVSRNVFEAFQERPSFDVHYGLELGIVLEGAIRRFKGRDMHASLGRGDMWFDGMWEPHGNQVVAVPAELVVIVVWPPLLAEARFPEAPSLSWMAPFSREGAVDVARLRTRRDQILRLGAEAASLVGRTDELALARLRLILFELLLIAVESLRPAERRQASGKESSYEQLTVAINAVFNSREPVANAQAAALCGLSEDKFMRLFKSTMGISFSQFALRFRLSRTAQEIAATDEPVKMIAAEWGFTDQSHLHRLFVRSYGCTPAEYRRRTRLQSTT